MKILKMLLAASVLLSTPAWAQDNYVITYRAAELNTAVGMQQVLQRIEAAARAYCPTYLEIRSHSDVRTCINAVIADLVEKVDYPAFTRYVAEQPASDIAYRD